ncbi:hypothetical protein GGX14DRAFT_407235 [Mycena pura]|uniref:Uncharacterized protein n=1 Tax=Mycena pura TaxID=153505 RepID=A0AAD6UNT8_9AGAR|nr:hypothetical protein GGX14DRAFT_407235 [Mycena pura]
MFIGMPGKSLRPTKYPAHCLHVLSACASRVRASHSLLPMQQRVVRPSKHSRILNDMEEQLRETQTRHFSHAAAELMDDLASEHESGDDSESDVAMSDISGVSAISRASRDESGSSSDSSGSFSNLADGFLATWEQTILEIMKDIESSRVIDEAPRIAKLSQLSLLDEWRATGHLNFRKKLRRRT